MPTFEQDGWRWGDRGAIRYELDRKQRQHSDASGMASAANAGAWIADHVPGAGAVGAGLRDFRSVMKKFPADPIQDQIDALQARKNRLDRGSRT
jgi:hypothetical protein